MIVYNEKAKLISSDENESFGLGAERYINRQAVQNRC